tara:strand:+ start:163 stop:1200 length:1038 start_codon:yes stop_codon:yes gene_type:complete
MKEIKLFVRMLFFMFLALLTLIAALMIGMFTYKPGKKSLEDDKSKLVINEWQPKDVLSELDSGTMQPEVKAGYLLIAETPTQMGPNAEDPNMRFAGNNLACANCHLKAGTQAGSASWVGVTERFPQFGGRSNKIGTIEDRINGCMERSMNGTKLPLDSKPMKAIVAYMEWLGEDLPETRKKEFEGYADIKLPDVSVDLSKGALLYQKECMLCHGENGQGIRMADAEKGYQFPPLWGEDSYNNGAGMHRVITAAEFIKGNMPFGQATWDNPKLTDQEAYDVAGYINSFDRPQKVKTENDYPDKKLKPVSTPYGPWADDFTAEQHKYGPFLPIIQYYKTEYNIKKSK